MFRTVAAAIAVALAVGCTSQVEEYQSNQPVETPLGPAVTFCLHMTMEGCAPMQPADPAFGGCENLDPLEQQEQGCWQGHGNE